MLTCSIKNIPSTFSEPSGNPGRNFPLQSSCPSPTQPQERFCPLLTEVSPLEFILLNDGQPITLDCILQSDNPITVTATYYSCPLQIDYFINSDFDVDVDIQIVFVNVLSSTTGPSLSYSVSATILSGTSIAFVSLSDLVAYGDLTQDSFFIDVSSFPANISMVSQFSNSVNFYSIFELLTSCELAVEYATPGFTAADRAYCNNVFSTEMTSGSTSIYAPCSAYSN